MNHDERSQILIKMFTSLRLNGFTLGVGELLAAFQAVYDPYINDRMSLEQTLILLWCHSKEEKLYFEAIWSEINNTSDRDVPPPAPEAPSVEMQSPPRADESLLPAATDNQQVASQPSMFPIQAPLNFVEAGSTVDLQAYWPVTRRHMQYIWRYLRRPINDGPCDILDVQATVEQAAQQGFFLEPVYRRRERNHAHLILLIDQDGSMTPFHRFSRDLADTARHESSLEQVGVFYFHNIVGEHVFHDPHLTQPVRLDRVLASCSCDTSILLVSDAGAARGYQRVKRIRATTSFLMPIKRSTTLIAWLNPMPKERWNGTSAQIIGHLVPMFQMDADGLRQAIHVVRGQPFQHY